VLSFVQYTYNVWYCQAENACKHFGRVLALVFALDGMLSQLDLVAVGDEFGLLLLLVELAVSI
jgi:hypothetical protein